MSDASSHEPGGQCRSCPVCLVLQALHEVRPDVWAHLAAAGRELALALHAVTIPESDSGGPSGTAQHSDHGDHVHDGDSPTTQQHRDARRLRRIDIQ
jgi:hypothetical protein